MAPFHGASAASRGPRLPPWRQPEAGPRRSRAPRRPAFEFEFGNPQAFTLQVEGQLPAFENEDWGLLLYGLASMGQPLPPALLAKIGTAAGRRMHGLGGDALGLLAWGAAQYGGPLPLVLDEDAAGGRAGGRASSGDTGSGKAARMPAEQAAALARRRAERLDKWWGAFYAECGLKWESTTARGAALMLIGLGVLDEAGELPLPPGEWQAGALGVLRSRLGRFGSWDALIAALRGAAGMDADEDLPAGSLWFGGMVVEWGARCGLEQPEEGAPAMLAAAGRGRAASAAAGGGRGAAAGVGAAA